jgi:serine protease AprX
LGVRNSAALRGSFATALALAVVALCVTANATAAGGPPSATFVPTQLLETARANPDRVFEVIVQGRGNGSGIAASAVQHALSHTHGSAFGLKRRLATIDGVSAELTGAQLVDLAASDDVLAITPDAPLVVAGDSTTTCTNCPFEGLYWPYLSGVTPFWPSTSKKAAPPPQAPGIAVVDSGVEPSNIFFGNRVVKEISFTTFGTNSADDSYGHGTFVAGLAAGSISNWGGASPTSKIVSLDVVNDAGEASTSDVIAAADWIYQNKAAYGIRVATFALTGTQPTTFMFDPLDKAVERLWLSGVVVVAAAGNYGTGGPSGVLYAPANDPFVITVGATDMNATLDPSDDFVAPWSAFGYTPDGFAKPELSAPGRYMIGTVPVSSVMPALAPSRLIASGWMWMSGTSFAVPVVAGAAADVLALHPTWKPDQVKGALMLTAKPLAAGPAWSGGVGQVQTSAAAAVSDPPNPNLALNQFLVPDPGGDPTPVFDAASWSATAAANPAWSTASWTTASWTTASWTTASWTTASWTTASWTTASWTTASWTTAAQPADAQLSLLWLP